MRNICAIKGKQVEQFFSDDPDRLEHFAQTWNRHNFDIYDCVSELTDGAQTRCLETVKSLSFVHVDIDMRALETGADAVLARLKNLLCPLEIRSSGGGFHVVIHLKEPVDAGTPEFERVNAVRKRLTYLLAGDPAPDHAAALLRRIGTQNFKYGEPRLCRVIQTGAPVDLTEIEELIDLLGDTPLFVAKERAPKINGHLHFGHRAQATRGRRCRPCRHGLRRKGSRHSSHAIDLYRIASTRWPTGRGCGGGSAHRHAASR